MKIKVDIFHKWLGIGWASGVDRGQLRGSSEEENDLRWKTTIDGKRPLMEDKLQWKTTFDGRQPSMDNNLRRKTIF